MCVLIALLFDSNSSSEFDLPSPVALKTRLPIAYRSRKGEKRFLIKKRQQARIVQSRESHTQLTNDLYLRTESTTHSGYRLPRQQRQELLPRHSRSRAP